MDTNVPNFSDHGHGSFTVRTSLYGHGHRRSRLVNSRTQTWRLNLVRVRDPWTRTWAIDIYDVGPHPHLVGHGRRSGLGLHLMDHLENAFLSRGIQNANVNTSFIAKEARTDPTRISSKVANSVVRISDCRVSNLKTLKLYERLDIHTI
jgi:hypothetical protein